MHVQNRSTEAFWHFLGDGKTRDDIPIVISMITYKKHLELKNKTQNP